MMIKTDTLQITQNYYLIVDLEATCSDDKSVPRHLMEIDEFQIFIQPILNPKLSNFCQELTSISQSDVDNAPKFPEALKLFKNWFLSFKDILFCSWGA